MLDVPHGVSAAVAEHFRKTLVPGLSQVDPADPVLAEIVRLAELGVRALLSGDERIEQEFSEQRDVVGEIMRLRHNRAVPQTAQKLILEAGRVALRLLLRTGV